MKIERVITDVDGCLTDGGVYVFEDGKTFRKFNTFDGRGVELLQNSGVELYLLTASLSESIIQRALWLNAELFVYKDKGQFVREMLEEDRGYFNKTAYFGNDTIDLDPMVVSMYVGCPSDSHVFIKEYVRLRHGFISDRKGGEGSFRDFVDWVMKVNRNYTPR